MPSALENAALAWRRRLLNAEREPLLRIQAVYFDSFARLQQEVERYTARIAQDDPFLPGLLHRRRAAQDAQAEIARLLLESARSAAQVAQNMQVAAVGSAFDSVRDMVAVQDEGVAVWLRRPNQRAIEMLLGAASDGSPLLDVFASATNGQAESLARLLAQNVALGINPRVTARQMHHQLGVAAVRAQTIARTETLRAYRAASLMTMQANDDVLDGWIRVEACDRRTCAACFALHGRFYRLDESPDEHINGRMTLVPKVKGTTNTIAPGIDRFAALSPDVQRGVLGHAAYEAYRDGAFVLNDLVGRTHSDQWGTSIHVRSLRSAIGEGKAKRYIEIIQRAAHTPDWREADMTWWKVAYGLREIRPAEWDGLLNAVAERGFSPEPYLSGRNAGKTTAEVHFEKHVLKRQEWPAGTTLAQYVDAGKEIIQNAPYVFSGKFEGHWRVTFVAPSGGEMSGPGGHLFTVLEYRLDDRRWATFFQPRYGDGGVEAIATYEKRSDVRWLKR